MCWDGMRSLFKLLSESVSQPLNKLSYFRFENFAIA